MLTYPRYIPLALVPEEFMGFGGSDYATLSQNIAGIAAGQMYFMTAQVTLPPSTAYCNIQFSAGAENLLSFDYGQSAQNGAVNASGIFKTAPTTLTLSVYCSDYSGGSATINTWAAFDNIQLSVYNPSAGTNPIRPVPMEALTNNDFSTGLSPWTTYDRTRRMTFAIIDGAARVTFNNIDARYESQSYYQQTMQRPTEIGQRVRVQADVYFYVPNGGTYCWGNIYLGNPANWYAEARTSQAVHVDATVVMTYGTNGFTFETSCVGTGGSTYVSLDNVYVTLNAP
jgi:hypothetical protein